MAKKDTLNATVLAFERKLDPSDAVFSAGRWQERDLGSHWKFIEKREKAVRGTISNRPKNAKEQDPAVLNEKIAHANPQRVDVAMLPNDCDTLRVRFTLRILGGAGKPSACNNSEYRQALAGLVGGYKEHHGYAELAGRYASNLANGRFLWRNRVGAEDVEVRVSLLVKGEAAQNWIFNAHDYSLRDFDCASQDDIKAIAQVIEAALADDNGFALFDVQAYARMGEGQEVYPSQEMIMNKGDKKGQKSKTLYGVGEYKLTAAMHSQKIGNALRTIDTWYPEIEGKIGPIAVEPYGSVTTEGEAYRQPKSKRDFYNLLDGWVAQAKVPETGDQHFVMATLIRGGVFGASDKD
jgi:CRISPR-associated protein Csy3